MNYDTLFQLIKFGIVGSLAALSYFICIYALVSYLKITPIIANVIAFFLSFIISFHGHRKWTFALANYSTKIRNNFFIIAAMAFLLSEIIVYVFNYLLHFHYLIAAFISVSAVPPFTFILSKKVFKPIPSNI